MMPNRFTDLSNQESWSLLVGAAKQAVEAAGYNLFRQPGRGRSNVWKIEKDGESVLAAIRTTKDRWIAFPPLAGGTQWKTLDDVDMVVVAAVDETDNPRHVEIYMLQAQEVRARFDAAYQARITANNIVKDNFGMWVSLDVYQTHGPSAVGSGLTEIHEPIAVIAIDDLLATEGKTYQEDDPETALGRDPGLDRPGKRASTIAEVLAATRESIAQLAGVVPEAVKLDLKIEY